MTYLDNHIASYNEMGFLAWWLPREVANDTASNMNEARQ